MRARHWLTVLLIANLLGACRRDATAEAETSKPAAAARIDEGPPASIAAPSGDGFGQGKIDWQPYEAGLAQAKAQNKPVCLVLSTGWCPHCKNYSRVFQDDKVAEQARRFVMIHVDADKSPDVARQYQPDGGYVPRTFFLAPDGTLARDIHAPRPKFLYFFDEHNPASLLGGMEQALRTLVR